MYEARNMYEARLHSRNDMKIVVEAFNCLKKLFICLREDDKLCWPEQLP